MLNGNEYAKIPVSHSTKMKEECNADMQKIKFQGYHWVICVDLKMPRLLHVQ